MGNSTDRDAGAIRSIDETSSLLTARRGGEKLRGIVFSPGDRAWKALERMSRLFTMELVVYDEVTEDPDHGSREGNLRCEFRKTEDAARELADCLSNAQHPVRFDSDRDHHFLLRGDSLPLAAVYEAASCASKGTEAFLSQVGLIQPASRPEFLLLSDGLLNPGPDVDTTLNIIRNVLTVWRGLGRSSARVALLAAIEQLNPGMPVTVASAETARRYMEGRAEGESDVAVEGPLSFDVALDEEAARDKGAKGEVAGRANILIGSSIEVASGIYIALTMLAKARSASVIVGGKIPLAVPFPSDTAENYFHSICLAALLSPPPHESIP